MIKDIVTETVSSQWIVDEIAAIRHPVLGELLRTQDKNVLVPPFIIFDHSKGRECLAKTYAISKDASVVLLQLIDNAKCSILLEIIELVPDCTVLEASRLIRKNVLRDII